MLGVELFSFSKMLEFSITAGDSWIIWKCRLLNVCIQTDYQKAHPCMKLRRSRRRMLVFVQWF
jgi:hypothetical protein